MLEMFPQASLPLLYNQAELSASPTLEAPPVFDDDGRSAARLLLGLGHALTSFVVRVIRGVDGHLLLNHPETRQLLGATGGGGGRTESTGLLLNMWILFIRCHAFVCSLDGELLTFTSRSTSGTEAASG